MMMDEGATIGLVEAVGVNSWIGAARGSGGARTTTEAWIADGAKGGPYTPEGLLKSGINPTSSLIAQKLDEVLNFLHSNTQVLSSCFLLAKIEEGTSRETWATPVVGPTSTTSWPLSLVRGMIVDSGTVPPADLVYFTKGLQAKSPKILTKKTTTTQ